MLLSQIYALFVACVWSQYFLDVLIESTMHFHSSQVKMTKSMLFLARFCEKSQHPRPHRLFFFFFFFFFFFGTETSFIPTFFKVDRPIFPVRFRMGQDKCSSRFRVGQCHFGNVPLLHSNGTPPVSRILE